MHEPLKQPVSPAEYLASISRAALQAGISWKVVEAKWPGIEKAFKGFDPAKVAGFSGDDIDKLMDNREVIRNRTKIEGIILNARRVLELIKEHGSFKAYLKSLGGFDDQLKGLHRDFSFMGESTAYWFLWHIGEKVPGWQEWEKRQSAKSGK
jgi:DNA-3-methyladenine glycosylase I